MASDYIVPWFGQLWAVQYCPTGFYIMIALARVTWRGHLFVQEMNENQAYPISNLLKAVSTDMTLATYTGDVSGVAIF